MEKLNKKGQEGGSSWVIIALVLGVIVLVVIALGFGYGFGNLWSKMKGFFGSSGDLGNAGTQCQMACVNVGDTTAYCNQARDVSGLTPEQGSKVLALFTPPLKQLKWVDRNWEENTKADYIDEREDNSRQDSSAKNSISVTVSADKKTVKGITCKQLVDAKLIAACQQTITCP